MRNAFIVLGVAALVIVVAGALNNAVVFDVDYVAGTVAAVSLFWVAAAVAAVVCVAGAIAVWLTQRAAAVTFRKLERELQTTYVRLREAEALVARSAPAVVSVAADVPAEAVVSATTAEPTEARGETDDGAAEATVVLGEAETVVVPSADQVAADEGAAGETALTPAQDELGGGEEPAAGAGSGAPDEDSTVIADSSQTAVTQVSDPD